MKRITGTYVDPTANGAGKPGFRNGVPGVSAPTTVQADWLNHMQEEIALAIEAAGLTLNPAEKNQLAQALIIGFTISPASLAATADDWAPTGYSSATDIRVANDSSAFGLTGIAADAARKLKRITNVGANAFPLFHDDSGSVAANRFDCPGDETYYLQSGDSVWIRYDATSSAWRVLDRNIQPLTMVWGAQHTFGGVIIANNQIAANNLLLINNVARIVGQLINYHATNEITYNTTRVRTKQVAIRPSYVTGAWGRGSPIDSRWYCSPPSSGLMVIPVELPHGATLTAVNVNYNQQAASPSTHMNFRLQSIAKDGSTGVDTSANDEGNQDATTNGVYAVKNAISAGNVVIDNAVRYELVITASDAGSGIDSIAYVDLVYNDPGLVRNGERS